LLSTVLQSKIFVGPIPILALGLLFGFMPIAAYAAPILVCVLAFIFGLMYLERRAVLLGGAVIQYCAVQYFYLQYHGSMPLWDFDLIKVYFVLSIIAVPLAAMVLAKSFKFERFEIGFFGGLFLATGLLTYQYFYQHQCRAVGFTFNPLVPPFVLIPILSYILARRAHEKRISYVDLVVIICGVLVAGLFPGGRMGLYSIVLMLFVIGLFCMFKSTWRSLVIVCGGLLIGITLTVIIDGQSGCNFLGRISSQVRIASDLRDSLEAQVDVTPIAGTVTSGQELETLDIIAVAPEEPDTTIADVAMDVMQRSESSSADRWFMWSNAVERISKYRIEWLTGVGWFNEGSVVNVGLQSNFKHSHNQFLSWLLWGGLPSLLSAALLFGVLPLRAFRHFPSAVFVMASGLGFMTNSLMLSGHAVAPFIMIILLVGTLEVNRQS